MPLPKHRMWVSMEGCKAENQAQFVELMLVVANLIEELEKNKEMKDCERGKLCYKYHFYMISLVYCRLLINCLVVHLGHMNCESLSNRRYRNREWNMLTPTLVCLFRTFSTYWDEIVARVNREHLSVGSLTCGNCCMCPGLNIDVVTNFKTWNLPSQFISLSWTFYTTS